MKYHTFYFLSLIIFFAFLFWKVCAMTNVSSTIINVLATIIETLPDVPELAELIIKLTR